MRGVARLVEQRGSKIHAHGTDNILDAIVSFLDQSLSFLKIPKALKTKLSLPILEVQQDNFLASGRPLVARFLVLISSLVLSFATRNPLPDEVHQVAEGNETPVPDIYGHLQQCNFRSSFLPHRPCGPFDFGVVGIVVICSLGCLFSPTSIMAPQVRSF